MNADEINKMIKAGESSNLEFKTSTAKLKSAFESLCAFLNTSGGSVLVGVKNDGRIVGQEVTDQTNLEISNMIAKRNYTPHSIKNTEKTKKILDGFFHEKNFSFRITLNYQF